MLPLNVMNFHALLSFSLHRCVSQQINIYLIHMCFHLVSQVHGRGVCGTLRWAAARESSKTNPKVDEEGLEVAVCRHSLLLKALNMYRGEFFAYPMYLQKELAARTTCTYFCTDVMCQYWPYLQRVAKALPDIQNLLQMTPLLSVMNAKGHATKCEVILILFDKTKQ